MTKLAGSSCGTNTNTLRTSALKVVQYSNKPSVWSGADAGLYAVTASQPAGDMKSSTRRLVIVIVRMASVRIANAAENRSY